MKVPPGGCAHTVRRWSHFRRTLNAGYPFTGHPPFTGYYFITLVEQCVISSKINQFIMASIGQRDDVDTALSEWRKGQFQSLRQAAQWHDIPLSTLTDRARGSANRATYNQTRQKLTVGEEETLVAYIRHQTQAGYPLSIEAVQQIANVLLRRRWEAQGANGQPKTVGQHWIERFYKRHNDIKAVKLRAMDTLRARSSTYNRLLEWFQIAREALSPNDIRAYNIYNMDETGVILGHIRTAKCVVATDVPTPY